MTCSVDFRFPIVQQPSLYSTVAVLVHGFQGTPLTPTVLDANFNTLAKYGFCSPPDICMIQGTAVRVPTVLFYRDEKVNAARMSDPKYVATPRKQMD